MVVLTTVGVFRNTYVRQCACGKGGTHHPRPPLLLGLCLSLDRCSDSQFSSLLVGEGTTAALETRPHKAWSPLLICVSYKSGLLALRPALSKCPSSFLFSLASTSVPSHLLNKEYIYFTPQHAQWEGKRKDGGARLSSDLLSSFHLSSLCFQCHSTIQMWY